MRYPRPACPQPAGHGDSPVPEDGGNQVITEDPKPANADPLIRQPGDPDVPGQQTLFTKESP